jgi:putative membrane protein
VLKKILLAWLVLALAMALASAVLPGFDVDEGFTNYLIVSLLFGLVNAFIGPIVHILTLPLTIITLGLFALVVNGALLAFTAWLTPLIDLDGFLSAIVAAIVIALFSALIAWIFGWREGAVDAPAT